MNNDIILAQIQHLLDQSQNILIISHTSIDGDGIGSGLALQMALTKLGKNIVFYSRNPVPEAFKFLPGIEGISNTFSLNQDFIIEIDTTQTEVDNIKTTSTGNTFKIVVTPKNGTLNQEDVHFVNGNKKIDLIFTLDTSTLEYTGLMNGPQAELFYETPVINIDHHITNEQYGKVNYVDIAATSTAELVMNVIESLAQKQPLMDDNIATCLLSGVIVDTGSFQNANTTPRAFAVAAKLLTAGARQQEIVRHLFKMHELSTLRLWGKALSHLEHDPELHLAWTTVTKKDFMDVNATEEELDGLMDQLITSASDADVVFLIKECEDGGMKVSLRSLKNIDITPIVLPFGGGGHQRAAGFKISDKDFVTASQLAIDAIKHFMSEYLSKNTSSQPDGFRPVQSTIKSFPQTESSIPVTTSPITPDNIKKAENVIAPTSFPDEIPTTQQSTPVMNYVDEPTSPSSTNISYSQSFPLPPSGVSKAQENAIQNAYTEPEKPLPVNDFLGYKAATESFPLMEESKVKTPDEIKAAEQIANQSSAPLGPITLKVTKENQ